MKNLKEESVDNNEILNIVNKIEEEGRTLEEFKKDYPDEIEKVGDFYLFI